MRPGRVRLGILVGALLLPCSSARAQTTTNTDAAIAELRQLLAEQRAALERQARMIEEQGRALAALRQQVTAANPNTQERYEPAPQAPAAVAAAVETQIPASQPARAFFITLWRHGSHSAG